jgi:DNA-binding XRE family transcriptional regulator
VVTFGTEDSSFSFSKVERKKLYVTRRRMALDAEGQTCGRAALTRDGRFLIRPGMTGQGYFTSAGYQVASKELVGLDDEGQALPKLKSTLGAAVELEGPLPATEVLDVKVATIYALEADGVDAALDAALDAGEVFRFPFRYRDGFDSDVGLLVRNDEGTFALIGRPAPPAWAEPAVMAAPVEDDEDDFDDDLDFDMF